VIPAEVSPGEERQFGLLISKTGSDRKHFVLRKFRSLDGRSYRTRVVGRGAATIYETLDPYRWMAAFAKDLELGMFGVKPSESAPSAVISCALANAAVALADKGLEGVLGFLNRRVPHRFTAVYRLEGGAVLRCVAVVDKHLHLEPMDLKTVPLKDSYCQFVLRDSLFITEKSGGDARLSGHVYAGVVNSYAGTGIRNASGALAGTLCHFDLGALPVTDDEVRLLEAVAGLLSAYLSP
jgi:GAF domain-containing protein